MKKFKFFGLVLLVLLVSFSSTSCGGDDEENDAVEENGGTKRTESILIGKWTPYTWDSDDYSFLEDVGWLEIKKNHTYEIHGYDKSLTISGDWDLIEPSGNNESKILLMRINKCGENYLNDLSKGSPYTKEQVESFLIGARLYMEIEDIFSNYMRTVKFYAIYTNGETETVVTKLEWRK